MRDHAILPAANSRDRKPAAPREYARRDDVKAVLEARQLTTCGTAELWKEGRCVARFSSGSKTFNDSHVSKDAAWQQWRTAFANVGFITAGYFFARDLPDDDPAKRAAAAALRLAVDTLVDLTDMII
jgi:hypothetical protein